MVTSITNFLRRPVVLACLTAMISLVFGVALAESVSPIWLAVGMIAALVFGMVIAQPELAAIALLAVTWGYLSEVAVSEHGLPSPSKALVTLLALVVVVRRFTGKRRPWLSDAVTWWMIGYLLVITLGLFYARYPNPTMLLVNDFAKDVLLYFVLINLIVSLRNFERGLWLMLGICALFGTLSIVQQATQDFDNQFGGLADYRVGQIDDDIGNRPRAGGPIGEPNGYGQQLLVLVPVGLWTAMYGRTRLGKIGGLLGASMCLAGIGLSFSRSTYIALGLTLLLYAVYIKFDMRYVLLGGVLFGALYLTAPPALTARFSTLEALLPGNEGVQSEGSFRRRSVEMLMAVQMFADHPLLGVGGGNYPPLYPQYIREAGSPVPDEERGPHSYYLEIAAEHGVLGIITVGSIMLLTISRLWQAQRLFASIGNKRSADMAGALLISFIGYLGTAIFLHGVYSRFLWLQVAMAVALAAIARRSVEQAATMPVPAESQPVSLPLAQPASSI